MRIRTSSRLVSSSITITPPVPIAEPTSRSESASILTPSSLSPRSGGIEEPPGITHLIFLLPITPPATSLINSVRRVPEGSSYTPGLLTCPLIPNNIVPGCLGAPILENHSQPFLIIAGMLVIVSTLLIVVGFPHKPFCAGNGGLTLG